MPVQQRRSSRHVSRNRYFAAMEALESRILMSYTWLTEVADSGDMATNGTNLQNVLNGTTKHAGIALAQGDTIVLTAGAVYLAPSGGFVLKYLAGAGTITIESADIFNNQGGLPSGVRVGASKAQYMPKLLTGGGNSPVVKTEIDASGNPTHNYSLLGLEISALNASDSIDTFVLLGDGTSNQSTVSEVAHDLTIDRCYIHGLDAVSNTIFANYQKGLRLNSANTTISNSEISNIHSQVPDAQAIGGHNGTGNFTITNNFLEGSSECFIYGGAQTFIDQNVPSGMIFTNNTLTKRSEWNTYDPLFYDVNNPNHQVKWNIKNLWEIKNFQHVTLDSNLFDNSWVGGDQVAPAILFTSKNQTPNGENPWVTNAFVTVTNNVIRYVGEGVQMAANPGTDTGFFGSPAHDITISNNLFENVDNRTDGPGYGIICTRGQDAMWNLTVEHNTFFNSNSFLNLGSSAPWESFVAKNFIFRDNLVQYGLTGIQSSAGSNVNALNTLANGLTYTTRGVGYTSAPTVTINSAGTGGSGATATASVDTATGLLKGITLTNRGSGYTSVPTVTLSGGGASSQAVVFFEPGAFTTDANGTGQLGAWSFTNNLIFGAGTPATPFPGNNIAPTGASGIQDAMLIRDPQGELQGLLANSPGHNQAHDGTDIGVNPATLTSQFVPLDSTMTGFWKFDEGTGTSASDSSLPGGHTGTLTSSTLWTSSGNVLSGLALTGGTSGSMSVANFPTTATFSFSAWIKPSVVNVTQYIASTGTGNQAFSLFVNSTGKLVASTSNGVTATDTTSLIVNDPASNGWYLVGCTYDSATNKLTLYKNGVAVATTTGTGTIGSGNKTLYIGGNGGSTSCFNGTIDEARYYNSDMSTLTNNKIPKFQQLYANYGPRITAINPGTGNATITSLTTTFTVNAVSHNTYSGMPGGTGIKFTWSVFSGPSGLTFDANNGTTAGTSVVGTWDHAGFYVMKIVAVDTAGGTTSTIGHSLSISGLPTAPAITGNTTVAVGGTLQFTNASNTTDQYGDTLPLSAGTWSVASGGAGGSIDPVTGLYVAKAVGTDTVQLKYGTVGGVVVATRTVTVSSTALPIISVVATDATANEQFNNNGVFTFTRSIVTASALTVNYTISGTATNGTDYQTITSSVTIPANTASATVTITPIDDSSIEGNESVILTLASNANYGFDSAKYSASVNLVDGGDLPTVTISATDATAGETAPNPGVYRITRSGTGPGLTVNNLNVRFNVSGTATRDVDYTGVWYSAVIPAGSTTVDITLTPVDDAIVESSETAILTLATNSAYTIGSPNSATVTITDNDTSSPPNAPTNLVATPKISTIDLTWTDNATNETGFHVYRSTDNSTWGSPYATIATPNTTAYSDPSPVAGTAYFYKVNSYNAAGDSTTGAGITCAVATVLAYEGFNYTVGVWTGGNTGLGFAASPGWVITDTTKANVVSGSLTNTNGGHALTTSANSVTLATVGNKATQTLANPVGGSGTLWFSYELNELNSAFSAGNLFIGATGNQVRLGTISGHLAIWGFASGQGYSFDTGITPATNTTYLLVAKVDYLTTGDVLTMWVNPQPGGASPTNYLATGSVTMAATRQLTSTTVLYIDPGNTAAVQFDEIRLGTTYASVSPDPIIDSPSTPRLLATPAFSRLQSTPAVLHNHHLAANLSTLVIPASDAGTPSLIETPSYHLSPQTLVYTDNGESKDPLLDDNDAPILEN